MRFLITIALSVLLFPLTLHSQDAANIDLANEYLSQGEVDKAFDLYKELVKDPKNIPFVHNSYFTLLLNLSDYKEAESYLEKLLKKDDSNINYKIDLGLVYQAAGRSDKADQYFTSVINGIVADNYKLRIVAQTFIAKQLREYALKTYLAGRQHAANPYSYSIELANIYRLLNRKQQMMEEYLNFAIQNPKNIDYVKNILQNLLTEPEDLSSLESLLIQKVQKNPNDLMYSELLVWVELQQLDFFGAFTQVKAIDRREKGQGQRVIEVGEIALANDAYADAEEIFAWVILTYPSSPSYVLARRLLIEAREGKVKTTYPVDTVSIRTLINDYDNLIQESGLNTNTLEALRSKALLHAFFLDEKDKAIDILQQVIRFPRAQSQLVSACKLDLGDIYLLSGEPWESTLLYSQVEKDSKESQLGYEAKLKNAKLSYYNGDFELAKAHLDILKLATSREISNDAMALSLLIQDNTVMDTTELAMREFAHIDLLLFQNKKQQALASLDSMLIVFPGHSITDEVWYKLAQLNYELGEPVKAISYLDRLLVNYPFDILGDDAIFLKAKILDAQGDDKQSVMDAYQALLTTYPGSIFVAEARKRFRELRGDLNQ